MCVMAVALIWLMMTPEGQKTSVRITMITLEESKNAAQMLEDIDFVTFFRQIGMNGGMYSILLGIWLMLFLCSDYQSGFIKNIMALHQNRWSYIGSKLIAAAIVNFLYLSLQFLFVLLLNEICGRMVPYTAFGDEIGRAHV